MKVREVMTDGLTFCSPNTDLATVASLMWDNDRGVVPALDDSGKVVGMITDRDICIAVATKRRLASDISVSEAMSRVVYACQPDDNVKDALRIMQHCNVMRLPVINDKGTLQGVLSIYNIVLQAGSNNGRKSQPLSSEQVINAIKEISGDRFE